MVEKMNTPLITDEKDPKWMLLGKNTWYCQFTKSQAGDGEAGDITGEPGWYDV